MPRMLMSLTCSSARGCGRDHNLRRGSGHVRECASGHIRGCGRGHVHGCERGNDHDGSHTASDTDSLNANDDYINPEVPKYYT